MKKKFAPILLLLPFACVLMCAFVVDKNSSLKDLTRPYVNTYECVLARLGEEDLLDDYEFFTITISEDQTLEISFKRKDGKKHSYKCGYEYDAKTGALTAETGILGVRFRQTTTIENGRFTLVIPILCRTLVMVFAVK